MDQEAAGGGAVVCRQWAMCCSQDGLRRARDPKRGEGPGNILQTESALGCLGNGVPGQSQRTGQGETRRHAKPVDTGGIQVKEIRHEESRHEREPRRLNDEADAETENRAAHEHHGLRVCGTVFEASGKFDEGEGEARELGADSRKVAVVLAWKVEFGRRGRKLHWES